MTFPSAFTKTTPLDGAMEIGTDITLNWMSSEGTEKYEYCLDISNDNTCTTWIDNGIKTSTILTGLIDETTYYWQVRAINEAGITFADGSENAYNSFTTGINPTSSQNSSISSGIPGAFSKSGPESGASVNQMLYPTLSWEASLDAEKYEYCIDTSNDNDCSMWVSTGTSTSVILNSLMASTTYYWQVRAVNTIGTTYANGTDTDYRSFTTQSVPTSIRTWTLTGSMNSPRLSHSSTTLLSGKVLAAGGRLGSTVWSSAEIYDMATATWSVTSSMNTARYVHTATLLNDGRVLVVGGIGTSGVSLASAEIYNPATGTWITTGSLSTARYNHAAVLLNDGRVLVVGGVNGSTRLSSVEIFDPASGTWTTANPLSTARQVHTATLLKDGRVLITGGEGISGYLNSAEIFDPVTGIWTSINSMNAAHCYHSATLLMDGRVLIAGAPTAPTAEIYDPSSGTWTLTGPMKVTRRNGTAVLLPDGKVLAAGGNIFSGATSTTSSEIYDPSSETWSLTASMVTPRALQKANLLSDGRVLMVGGDSNNTATATTEIYFIPEPYSFGKTTPTNSATHQSANLTLNWNSSQFAEKYEYCIDTTNDNTCGTWLNNGTSTSASLSNLAAETTYYWQVRAVNPVGTTYANGSETAFFSFKIGNEPATFSKVSPANGTNVNQLLYPTLSWDSSTGADKYEYCIDTTNDNTCSSWVYTGTNTSVILNSLTASTTYYWQVRAVNSAGEVYADNSVSDFRSFTTQPAPVYVDTWTSAGSMNSPRYSFSSTALLSGKVLAAGGRSPSALSSVEIFDPNNGIWTTTTSMGTARYVHTAILLNDGRVLVAGGYDASGAALSSVEIYDPVTALWTATGSLNIARGDHAAVLLNDGRILVVGGINGGTRISSAEVYDPHSGTWTTITSMSTARYAPTATLLKNGKVLVVGGENASGFLNSAEVFDPETGSWTYTNIMNTTHCFHSATLLMDGRVLIAGTPTAPTAEIYDPSSDTWTLTGPMKVTRRNGIAVLLPDGKVLAAGGDIYEGSTYSASAEVYDPTTGTWSLSAPMLYPRSLQEANLLSDGRVLVIGGYNGAASASTEFRNLYYFPPVAFSKETPLDKSIVLTPLLRWGISTGAEKYEYCIDTTNDDACNTWVNADKNTSVLLENLAKNVTYYWQVRAVNKIGTTFADGGESALFTFSIASSIDSPVLNKPMDNSARLRTTPTFSWLFVPGATAYEFRYDDDPSFESPVSSPALTGLSYLPTKKMTPLVKYYWQVRSRDTFGDWGLWSSPRSITLLPSIPAAPVLRSPVAASFTNDTTPVLSWMAVTGSGITYQVQVDNLSTFTSPVDIDVSGISITSFTSPELSDGLKYWRVRAFNAANEPGPWSSTRTFTVDTAAPAIPVLSKPLDNPTRLRITPTFSWLTATGAKYYEFRYDDDPSFGSPYTSPLLTVLTHLPTRRMTTLVITHLPTQKMTPLVKYYWQVRARDAAGNWSSWSTARSITLQP